MEKEKRNQSKMFEDKELYAKAIANAYNSLIAESEYTQSDVAEKLGILAPQLNKFFTGKTQGNLANYINTSKAMGIKPFVAMRTLMNEMQLLGLM